MQGWHFNDEYRKHQKGNHTYSRELVKKIGRGLDLNADEMRGFMGAAGF